MTAPFVEYAFYFLLYNFGFLAKNQVFISVWIYVRVFDSIPLSNVPVFMQIPSCFYYYGYIALESPSGVVMPPEVLLLYRIVLDILRPSSLDKVPRGELCSSDHTQLGRMCLSQDLSSCSLALKLKFSSFFGGVTAFEF